MAKDIKREDEIDEGEQQEWRKKFKFSILTFFNEIRSPYESLKCIKEDSENKRHRNSS